MVGEEIPILCADNLVNMKKKEGDTANDYVNEEELIEYDKIGSRYAYVTEEVESKRDENNQ